MGGKTSSSVMTWSLALMMGVTLGGLMKVLQWTLGNMHLWHSVFLVLGLGALVVGFIGSTRAKRIPAEPGAWLYLITGVFSLIACCFYEDLPVLAGVGPRPIRRCVKGVGSLCFSGGDFRGMPYGSSSFVHGLSGG